MHRFAPSRPITRISLAFFAILGAAACGPAPTGNETSGSSQSADTATVGCYAATSCDGILDGPPDIVITCPSDGYQFDEISPAGTKSFLTWGSQYTGSMGSYATAVEACQLGCTWTCEEVPSTCKSFSTYTETWCPGPSGGGGGAGGGVRGKGGCTGTCS
jgi:hypothetical protein